MRSLTVLEKLLEIRSRGLEDEFEMEADIIGDWDEIHSMLAGMTVDEFLNIEEEEEKEDEEEEEE